MRSPLARLSLILLLALPRVASADEMTKEAEARFQEGLDLARGGKYEEARAKFLQSLAVSKSPKTLLNLTIAEKNSGHPTEALRHLRAYLRDPSANASKVAELKKELLPELYGLSAHLKFEAPLRTTISCDGEAIDRLDEEYDVTPGPHVIASLFEGKRETKNVLGEKGALVTVTFAAPIEQKNEAKLSAPPPLDTPPPSYWTARRVAGVGLIGVGLGVGIVGFAIAKNAASTAEADADALRSQLSASGTSCQTGSTDCTRLAGFVDDRVSSNGWASLALLTGGILAVGGAVLVLLPSAKPKPKEAPKTSLVLAPRVAEARGSVGFRSSVGGATVFGTF